VDPPNPRISRLPQAKRRNQNPQRNGGPRGVLPGTKQGASGVQAANKGGIKMISDEKSLTSNSFECLQTIRGEVVKVVLAIPSTTSDDQRTSDWLIVFESGYSLQVHYNMSYWINSKKTTAELIQSETERRKNLIENLQEAQELLEAS